MLDARWRAGVERTLGPLGDRLRRLGVTADALTVFGLVCAIVTAVLIATGHLGWAVVGLVASGIGDLLDGTVARRSGQASPRGAFFDSVSDRLADAVVLGGVAWYLVGEDPYAAVLAFAVAALSMLISYERAKAESLGLDARGGIMERAERVVLLAVGLAFGVLVPVLWVMAALSAFTVVQRFVRVWRQAGAPPRPVHRRRRRREETSPSDGPARPRLRAWWEQRRPAAERARRRHPSVRRRTRP